MFLSPTSGLAFSIWPASGRNWPTNPASCISGTVGQREYPRALEGEHDDTARALERRPWEDEFDPMAGVAVLQL